MVLPAVYLQLPRIMGNRSCNYLYIITMMQVIMPISLADLSSRPWARSGSHNEKGGFIRPPTRCPPSPDNFQKGFPPQLRSRVKTGYPDVCRGYLPVPQRRPSVPTSLWRGTPSSSRSPFIHIHFPLIRCVTVMDFFSLSMSLVPILLYPYLLLLLSYIPYLCFHLFLSPFWLSTKEEESSC